MKTYHILNGDALLEKFPYKKQEIIVARECFIEGNLQGNSLKEFWKNRAITLKEFYNISAKEFEQKTVLEFQKFDFINTYDEVNLWFEFDLFCQCNFWFCCYLLHLNKINKNVFFVFPNTKNWHGFGVLNESDLKSCYENKVKLTEIDLENLSKMWLAYQNNNEKEMQYLTKKLIPKVNCIEEVVEAHFDRNLFSEKIGRPEKVIQKILQENPNAKFPQVFKKFWETEGIYGFGDIQIKRLYENVISM